MPLTAGQPVFAIDADHIESLAPATTTELLTGTSATKITTPDSIAALWEQGSDIASATTISVGEGGYFHVTGTTGITDIDFATDRAGRKVWLKFNGILTLTHHSTTLILPTGANISTAAGDIACFVSEGSDNVRCISYTRASGASLAGGGGMSIGGAVTSGTSGSIPFIDGSANLAQDNAAMFWDATNDRLGLGANSSLNSRLTVNAAASGFGIDFKGADTYPVWMRMFDGGGTERSQFAASGDGIYFRAYNTIRIGDNSNNWVIFGNNVASGSDPTMDVNQIVSGKPAIGMTGHMLMREMTAPSAPGANNVHIYAADNGAGKTALYAIFGSGAAQQIAIEP